MGRTNNQLDNIDKSIGHKIYSLRLAKGLSRQQLSKVIGELTGSYKNMKMEVIGFLLQS